MEMLQGVWKQHLRPRAVVGYGVKIFLPSPPHYVTRSPGMGRYRNLILIVKMGLVTFLCQPLVDLAGSRDPLPFQTRSVIGTRNNNR